MSLDELLRPKETEVTRSVKERCHSLTAALEKRGEQDAQFEVHNAIVDYAKRVQGKYPELIKKTEAYHALIGSGIPFGIQTISDFPNQEDSVATFLDILEKQFLGTE